MPTPEELAAQVKARQGGAAASMGPEDLAAKVRAQRGGATAVAEPEPVKFEEGKPAPGASDWWNKGRISPTPTQEPVPAPKRPWTDPFGPDDGESPDAYRERITRDHLPAAVAMETAKHIGGAVAGATVEPIQQGVEKRTAMGTIGGIARGGFGAGLLTTPVGAAFLSSGMASRAAHEAEADGREVPAITKYGAGISKAFEEANAALPDFEKMRLESRRLGMPVAEAMSEVGQLANEALPIAVLGGAHEVAPRVARAISPFKAAPEIGVPRGGVVGTPDTRALPPPDLAGLRPSATPAVRSPLPTAISGETTPIGSSIEASKNLRPKAKPVSATLEGQTVRAKAPRAIGGGTETAGRATPEALAARVLAKREAAPAPTPEVPPARPALPPEAPTADAAPVPAPREAAPPEAPASPPRPVAEPEAPPARVPAADVERRMSTQSEEYSAAEATEMDKAQSPHIDDFERWQSSDPIGAKPYEEPKGYKRKEFFTPDRAYAEQYGAVRFVDVPDSVYEASRANLGDRFSRDWMLDQEIADKSLPIADEAGPPSPGHKRLYRGSNDPPRLGRGKKVIDVVPAAESAPAPRKVREVAKNRFILQEQSPDGMWRKSGEAKTAAEAQAWEGREPEGLSTKPAEVDKPRQPEPAQPRPVQENVPTISDKAKRVRAPKPTSAQLNAMIFGEEVPEVGRREAPPKGGFKPSGLTPDSTMFNAPQRPGYAWRGMDEAELRGILAGERALGGGQTKRGNWFAAAPQSAGQFVKPGGYLVEFGGAGDVVSETIPNVVGKEHISAVWKRTAEGWERVKTDAERRAPVEPPVQPKPASLEQPAPAAPVVQAEPSLVARMREKLRAGDEEGAANEFRALGQKRTTGTSAEKAAANAEILAAEKWAIGTGAKPTGKGMAGMAGNELIVRVLKEQEAAKAPAKGKVITGGKRSGRSERGTIGDAPRMGGGIPKPAPERMAADPETNTSYSRLLERMNVSPKQPTVAEKVKSVAKGAYDSMIRNEGPVARFEKEMTGEVSETGPTASAKKGQGAASRQAHDLKTAGVIGRQPALETPLQVALDKVKSGPLRKLSAYLSAKRFATRYDPAELPTGMTPADTARIIADVEANHPDMVAAQKAHHATYRASLRNVAEADRWDPKRLAAIEKANPDAYAPIQREIETGKVGRSKIGTGPMRNETLKQVTGGDQPFRDPLSLIDERLQRDAAAADKARVKHKIVDLFDANKDRAQELGWMEELTGDEARKSIPKYDEILEAARKLDDAAPKPEDVANYIDLFNEPTRGDVFPIRTADGVRILRVKEPTLATWMRGDVVPDGPIWATYEALAKQAERVTGLQRLGTTVVRPAFWLTNAVRDYRTYMQLTDAGFLQANTNYVRGAYHSVRGVLADLTHEKIPETDWSRTYKRLGVEGMLGVDQSRTRAMIAKLEGKRAVRSAREYARKPYLLVGDGVGKLVEAGGKAIDVTRTIGSAVEGAPRHAEMIGAGERLGVNPKRALTEAQEIILSNKAAEITTNFRLGGRAAKQWNRWEAFFNARLQGAENIRQAWVKHPGRMAARTMAYSVLPEMALWAYINSDEKRREAYNRLPAWRRMGMFNIPYQEDDGSYSFVSLPAVSEIDLPAKAIRAALDSLSDDDPVTAGDTAKEITKSVAPIGGDDPLDVVVPSSLQPTSDVIRDKSGFTGRPIDPAGAEGVAEFAPSEVRRATTSSFAVLASRALESVGMGLTPTKIDHLIAGYTGPVGRDITRIDTDGAKEKADRPLIGRFAPRESESAFVDRFYKEAASIGNRRSAFISLAKKDNAKADDLVTSGKLVTAIGKIKEVMKSIREDYEGAKDGAEKRKLAHELDEYAKLGLGILKEAK